MKKTLLLSALTCGLLLSTTAIQAKTPTKTLIEKQINKHTKEQQKAPKEVLEGIQATFNATHLIQEGKLDEAKKLLKTASDNFEKALKADPKLDLIPLEESLTAYSFTESSDTIKARLDLTRQLIKANDTQAAIEVLSTLKDELDITVVALPMKLYPVSTKAALDALNKGDKTAALIALAEGFDTLLTSQIVIPTPLLTAQDLIIDASLLDKSQKEDAQKLLGAAKEELKRATLLGYTKKYDPEYKLLNDGIEKVQKEIKGENKIEKLYDTVKEDFKKIVHNTRITKVKIKKPSQVKISNDGLHDSVGVAEEKALKAGHVKGEAAAKAAVEETRDKDKFKAFDEKETSHPFVKEDKKDEKDAATAAQIKTINAENKNNPSN